MSKFLTLYVVLFGWSCSLFAQDSILDSADLVVKFRYTYADNLLNLDNRKEAFMSLQIGKTHTLFYNFHNEYVLNWLKDNESSIYVGTDAMGRKTYMSNPDKPRTKGATEYIFMDKNAALCTYVTRIVFYGWYSYQEAYVRPIWSLYQEQMQILDYSCQKAVTQFKGREWTVWYTPEIPIDAGPWKLSGLPGLILYATDSEGQFLFEASSIEKPETPVPIMHQNPARETATTKAKIDRILKKLYEERDVSGMSLSFDTSSRPEMKINFIER